MTAIVPAQAKTASRLALVGLLVPGLGHLVPWVGTATLDMRVNLRRLRLRHDKTPASRQAIADIEDERDAYFHAHGDHGDFQSGINLLSHVALVIWAAVWGLPRLSEVVFSGVNGTLDWHGPIGITYFLGTVVVIWWLAYRRAFPRQLDEATFNSNFQVFKRTFKKNRTGMLGLAMVAIMISLAFVTPMISPFDPATLWVGAKTAGPGWHVNPDTGSDVFCLLGTDTMGRDLFSRLLYGARISLSIGFLAVGIAGTLGTSVGAAAGYFGGWVDKSLMWLVDFLISVPRLVLLLAILGIFGSQNLGSTGKLFLIITVLALTGWMGVSRIVRSQVLSLSSQDFIQAARALGYSPVRIVYGHLVPNALAPVIVYASLAIGATILVEAALSFLGLGVSGTPTWGSLVAEGKDTFLNSPWLATFPGLCIVWAVMSFNLVGDGLRDALDPKLRGK